MSLMKMNVRLCDAPLARKVCKCASNWYLHQPPVSLLAGVEACRQPFSVAVVLWWAGPVTRQSAGN